MTTAEGFETSVTVNISPIQDYMYVHADNHVHLSITENYLTFLQQASHNHLSSIQTIGDQKIVKIV